MNITPEWASWFAGLVEVWRTFVLLHASPKNATDPRLTELFEEIKSVRRFEEPA